MKQRTIKFKAKRLDNGDWVEGDLYHNVRGFECCIGQQEKDDVYVYPVDPFTVCQFTGLKDKDGKEVWEHDLLKYITEREVIIGSAGTFLKGKKHLLSFMEIRIENGKLVCWSSHGSIFDRKEGEK